MRGLRELIVEKNPARIEIKDCNLLVADIDDMQTLEDWEERLDLAKQEYAVAYRTLKGKIVYSIFTKLRKKGSMFR